ncbi:hypothetical protein KHA80_22385 [Anaerobacillus sp. HL2]|nr:hypothetical protein KHA80_22385 [Anaerobacillus sp. HL2]
MGMASILTVKFNETQQFRRMNLDNQIFNYCFVRKNNNIANEVWKDCCVHLTKSKQIPTVVEVISPFDENMIKSSNVQYFY